MTGKKVAMKTLKISVLDEGIPKTSVREIALLKHLSHPCIVKLLDQECYGGKLHMIFEFVDQDLKRYMDLINGPMKPENIKSITSQIVQGVDYCHMNGVLHRDLKPQNILVSNSLNVKIADFGMARAFVPPMRRLTHEVVSLWYRPPEILLGTDVYSLPADMWAVGAILAEMIGMRPLFFARSEVELLINIFKILGTPTSTIWPEVTKLRYWNGDFPKFPSLKINKFLPDFCEDGIGMIEVSSYPCTNHFILISNFNLTPSCFTSNF